MQSWLALSSASCRVADALSLAAIRKWRRHPWLQNGSHFRTTQVVKNVIKPVQLNIVVLCWIPGSQGAD